MKMSSLISAAAALAFLVSGVCAQEVTLDQKLSDDARQLLESGKYAEAASAYESLVRQFPTSPFALEAQSRIGYALFLAGDFEKSTAALNKVLASQVTPEIKEFASSLLPQVLNAKAEKLPPGDARKAAYKDAIKEFENFVQKFPSSPEVESANYGRAIANFQVEQFDEAATALLANLKNFPTSDSALDTQYLLGLVYASQANVLLHSEDAASKQQAGQKFEDAEKVFQAIIQKRSDVALANDAQFQVGEILFVRGAQLTDKEQRAAIFKRALDAYRSVAPKQEMQAAQQARIAAIQNAKKNAAGNIVMSKRLNRFQEREQAKLAQMEGKPDQTVMARVRTGVIYFMLEQYDEARVVFRFMEPFVEEAQAKKDVLYYKTFTYAQQNLLDKAVEGFNQFMEAYKGDPMADNMPVAIGGLFLASNNPEKAIELFKMALELYPNGRFAAEAVNQQATALLQLKRYDEAKALYAKSLTGNAKKELAANAQFGIANIDKDTGKLDEALDGFKKVRDNYPDSPQVEYSCFWIPQILLVKQDPKGAETEFNAFVSKFPNSQLVPTALMYLSQAQLAGGNKETALATLKDLAEKHADSEPAPFAYFQMAQIYSSDQKVDDMVKVMRDFIAKYPESDKAFGAYDTIAQVAAGAGKFSDAVATYLEFAQKQPKNEQAPSALLKAADLQLKMTVSLGRYIAMNQDQRADWDKRLKEALSTSEKLVQEYPESQQVSLAMKVILECQKLLLGANLKSEADVQGYFDQLAAKFASAPATKTKVLFTYASFVYDKDKAKGLSQMNAAFDTSLVYAPTDLDLYGSALIEAGKLDEAQKVYDKVSNDYPNPAGLTPDKAPAHIMEAQAIALFGLGKVLQEQGKNAEAGVKFDQLKSLYPWSPKVLEASYGIALADVDKKDFDKASLALGQIIRATNAPAELRAKSMLLVAKIHEAKGNIDGAIDNYGKIAAFYDGIPAAASEGLFKAGQLIEQQLPSMTDEKKKAAQKARAIKFYKDLTEKYASSPFAPKAAERLSAIGQ